MEVFDCLRESGKERRTVFSSLPSFFLDSSKRFPGLDFLEW